MIGKKINALRKVKNLTLQELGETAGLSAAFLSQVERELSSPSVASLAGIARALDVNPSYFFPPPEGNGLLVQGYARQPFRMDEADVVYARLGGDLTGRSIEPLHATYPPGYESEVMTHAGEEFYYVIAGQLVIVLDGEEYKLSAEDSMHFFSDRPHQMLNRADTPVHVIAVTTPALLD